MSHFLRCTLVTSIAFLAAMITMTKGYATETKSPPKETALEPLKPVGGMQMWYYPVARLFRYPIPTKFEFAYIDKKGSVVISGPFVYAQSFSDGVARVKLADFEFKDDKWELLSLSPNSGHHALLHSNGELELKESEVEILPSWNYENGPALARENGRKFGYKDKAGNFVISPKYDRASEYSEGLAAVGEPHGGAPFALPVKPKDLKFFYPYNYSYIDKRGGTVITDSLLAAEPFSEGLASVMRDGNWGFITKAGNFEISNTYDWAGSFNENLAPVEREGKVGFINKQGNVVIPFKFKNARSFSEGLAPATVDGKNWGFIDRSGKFAIKESYQNAFPFNSGLALVYVPQGTKIGATTSQALMLYTAALRARQSARFNSARAACLKILQLVSNETSLARKSQQILDTSLLNYTLAPDVEHDYQQAQAAFNKDPEKTKALLERCLKKDPKFYIVEGAIASYYNHKHEYEKSIQLLTNIIREHPNYARGYFRLSQAYEGKADLAKAALHRQKAQMLAVDDPMISSKP